MSRLLGVVCVAVALAGVCALAASSLLASGQAAWPDRELVIEDRSKWTRAVHLAVEQWNAAQIGVRFRFASPGERADVTVVTDDALVRRHCAKVDGPCDAYATRIGWQGGGPVQVVTPRSPMDHTERHPADSDVRLMVHELGHVLGLRHRSAPCSSMRRDVRLLECAWWTRSLKHGRRFCGPLASDVARAARLYGGPGRPQPMCRQGA